MRRRVPDPRTEVVLGRAVPGWLLRGVLAGLVVGASALLTSGAPALVAAIGLAALLVWRPQAALVGLAVGLLAALVLLGNDGSIGLPVHGVVLAAPLLLRLGALCEQVAWRGVVEMTVLARAGGRLAVVQLPAQLLTVLAGRLAAPGEVPWLGVVAVAALGALGWTLLSAPRAPR